MITSVLSSDQYESIDFFFSAFMEDQSILASYIKSSKTFYLLDFVTKSSKLPISYLKFLLFIDYQPQLTESQILSLFEKVPLLTFEFIERFPIVQLNQIWTMVLNKLFSIPINEIDSKSLDSQLDIFYCFIQSSLMHINLVSLVTKSFIHRIFDNFLFLNNTIIFSEQKWSILLILLVFSRIDDDVSYELAEFSEFERFLRKIVLNLNENFELIKNYFFWVLNPTSPFPIEGIMPLHAKYVYENLKFPSVTFSKEIAPVLLSLLMIRAFSGSLNESKISNFASELIEMWNESKNKNLHYNIFLGLSNEEALKLLVPLSMTNLTCFDLLCKSLSFSCQFSAFSMVYNTIGEDHQKFLQFLTVLAKQAPIVNDFVRLKRPVEPKINCFEKTVALWIRIIKENSTIATFQIGENSTFVIKYQMNTFIFDVNNKKIKFLTSVSDIEGWHFICINFSKDSITTFVNLEQVTIENYSNSPIIMAIGDDKSLFDFQSVRVFQSILTESQITYLFFLGPNIKKLIIDNLSCVEMREKSFLHATSDGYLSNVYSSWISHVKYIKSCNYSNDFRLEFDISPPFISNDELFPTNELDLAKERFHLQPFFNSLEAFGGFPLLIHIFAEIILREKKNHEFVFELIFVLLNRFPFVHHIFVKNKYYQIISQLLKKTSEKVDFLMVMKCAITSVFEKAENDSNLPVFSNIIISNSDVLKHWILSPSIYYSDTYGIIEKIYESLQSKYEEYNLNIIFHSPIFSFISNSFLNSKTNSNKLFELLISLRLKITTRENVKENINTIIQCLLEYHFSSKENINEKNDENNEQSEIFLLTLLIQIFIKFPESILNSSLQDLLPLFTCATVKVKAVVFDILMKYLNPKFYSDFIMALQYSKPDRQFIEQVFHHIFKFINYSENMKPGNFHYITIPLLYFLYRIEMAEDLLISFCSGLNGALQNIPKYPEMMLNHFFRSFYLLINEKPNMAEKHLEPKFENSFTRIPQLLLMYINLVWLGVFKSFDQSYDLAKFLLDLLLIDYGKYSIFILSSAIDNLKENSSKNYENVVKFVDFCFTFLILTIQLRNSQQMKHPTHIQLFVISLIRIMNHLYDKFKIKNLIPRFLFMISEIKTNYSDVYSTLEDDLKNCKFSLKKNKSFKLISNSIENYMEYLSFRKERIIVCINNSKNVDQEGRFKDFYNRKIIEKQESNEGLIYSWKVIFNTLHFPASLIHKNCPEKFKIDEFSKKYQIHRVLFPVNPAYERFYLDSWSEKYLEEEPKVKLTMKDVINEICISHSQNILFTEKIIFHHGVKSIEGTFSMNYKKLYFYFPSRNNEIIIKLNDISRIILNEYQHQPSAFSVEDKYENLYSFAFKNKNIRADFVEKTKKIFTKKNVKIIKRFSITELNAKTREWENGNLSNFEYLINLNFISGRSWSDFTRYPIFPWVFSGLCNDDDNENNEEQKSQSGELNSNEKINKSIDSNQEIEKSPKTKTSFSSTVDSDKSKFDEQQNRIETASSFENNDSLKTEKTTNIENDNESKLETASSFENNDSLKTEKATNIENNNDSILGTTSSFENNDSLKTEKVTNIENDNESKLETTSSFEINDSPKTFGEENESKITKTMNNESDFDSDLNIELASEEPEAEMAASSPLFIPSENEESLNHSAESLSSLSRSEHWKASDNALTSTATESVDNSEVDVSFTSTSEETKAQPSPLFQVTFKTELKSIKSTPAPKLGSVSSTPRLSPVMTVPLSFFNHSFIHSQSSENNINNSSTEKGLKLAHSASSFLSESSYKLDILHHQTIMQQLQQNNKPLFRIKTFEDVFLIHSKSQYIIRNLCLPFYAQTAKQQQSCINYYHLTKRIENDPHHYSSYLSNISSALYFLVRLEPSTTFEIDHQDGKLDAADRTFQSLELTLQVMSSPDSRSAIELIPEFFFMPEIMMNINGINFPRSPIHKRVIKDVIIPKWAKNHFQYIRFLRKLLESEKDSCTINVWIDMVWGMLRDGKLAHDHFNVFQKIVFNFDQDKFTDNPKLLTAFQTQIVNCGQAPFKLFGFLHPRRNFQPKKRKLANIVFNDALVNSKSCEFIQILNAHNFSPLIDPDEIEITVNKNFQLLFAHKNVPLISFWNIVGVDGPNSDSKSRITIEFVGLMRGNLVRISALDFSENRFFVAGHFDGKLSTFCLNSCVHFLRVIECPLNFPISMVKVMNDNSSIIAFQNFVDQNNNSDSCLVSLFSINGMLIEKLNIDDHVIDCTLSSFFNGIQTNYAFILTKKGKIIALSMNSLKIKMQIESNRDDLDSLYLKDNFILSVVTNSKITFSWRLF